MKKTILALSAVLALSACSEGTKQDLGLINTPPDEFAVVTRAPLSVPPDYALRPPRPGMARPMEMSTKEEARKTVFGEKDVKTTGSYVDSEKYSGFLGKFGIEEVNPDIREIVDTEDPTDNRTTAERLLRLKGTEDLGDPIDPNAEYQRLREEGVVKRTVPATDNSAE